MAMGRNLTAGCCLAGWLLCLCTTGADVVEQAAALRAECARLVEQAGDAMTVEGKDNWLFLKNELQHVSVGKFWGDAAATASRATRDDRKDPLPVIIDVHQQLDALGIELMLVPVPPKCIVYPDMLMDGVDAASGPPPRLDVFYQEFCGLLRAQGVNVIDIFPDLAAGRVEQKDPMYCKSDTHWSGLACVRVARRIAAELKTRDWYDTAAKTPSTANTKQVTISGDLGMDLPEGDPARTETLALRFVSGGDQPLEDDPHSPVLLLADSHGLVFRVGGDMHALGAGFWDQLALELQMRPASIAVRGSGATPTRISLYRKGKADPEFITTKKVVIWLFTAREFTGTTGWTQLPVKR